jgi:hypothetical protein
MSVNGVTMVAKSAIAEFLALKVSSSVSDAYRTIAYGFAMKFTAYRT